MRVRYRVRQLVRAVMGRMTPDERERVAHLLSPAELRLFGQMPLFDQRHCFDVYQTLVRAGETDPTLLRAALLHDVGKVDDEGRPIPLLYYGLFVLLKRFAPALYTYSVANGRGPLRPFAIHAVHEQRSAQRCEAAASSPELVVLLRDYAAHRETPMTRALAWADDQN